ncbi:hypothetical protein BOX15_Mlig008232g1, partial [Macrostomum lignano]
AEMREAPPLPLLIALLAFAAGSQTESGAVPPFQCPSTGWHVYSDWHETTCLKLMPNPMLLDEALRTCFESRSRLLSFQHKHSKVQFVNDLIIAANPSESHRGQWLFDPLGIDQRLVKQPHHPEARWLLLCPNVDPSKIELLANTTAVPRNFVCEAPARPAQQRPQIERDPEDAFVTEDLLVPTTGTKSSPFVVTFNCQAFGLPKPTVSWTLVSDEDQLEFSLQPINANVVHSPRLPIDQPGVNLRRLLFYNLQRDCKRELCPTDGIQESSQLIVVNAQLLLADSHKRPPRVACIAANSYGSVLSREAQLMTTRLGHFSSQSVEVFATIGQPVVTSNAIAVKPDAASIECFLTIDGEKAQDRVDLIPMEAVNQATRGGLQLSRAKFDFIVDSSWSQGEERYLCQVSLPNGRLGHVTRERTLLINYKPCQPPECNLAFKPVSVVPGYPAVLSMNPYSSQLIRHGDSFLLECPCTGKRHPVEELLVGWKLNNGANIEALALPTLPQGSILLLSGADSLRHSGLYACRCHRGATASDWRSVQVNVLPSLTPSQWTREPLLRVRAGKNFSLNCKVDSVKDIVSVSVQPLRNTRPIVSSERIQLNQPSAGRFRLSIFNVTVEDAGLLGCRVVANYSAGYLDVNTYYVALMVEAGIS